MRCLGWRCLARPVWMLRLMIVFWVQCLGARADWRQGPGGQPASLARHPGAARGWAGQGRLCQNNKIISQHTFLTSFVFDLYLLDFWVLPTLALFSRQVDIVGEIMNGSKTDQKTEEYKHLPAFQMRERRESSTAPGSFPANLFAARNWKYLGNTLVRQYFDFCFYIFYYIYFYSVK